MTENINSLRKNLNELKLELKQEKKRNKIFSSKLEIFRINHINGLHYSLRMAVNLLKWIP
jgi:hypothetical protein